MASYNGDQSFAEISESLRRTASVLVRRAATVGRDDGDRPHRAVHQKPGRGISKAEGSGRRARFRAGGNPLRFGNRAGAKFFCFKDPDGTFPGIDRTLQRIRAALKFFLDQTDLEDAAAHGASANSVKKR
jgi:hypothetical protein